MQIRTFSSPDAAGAAAADLVADLLSAQPESVLALPTGHTPVPLYRALVLRHREGRADFSRASAFSMDELIGIAPDHPASYQAFLREHLFRHVNIAAARTHLLTGTARNWRAEAARIEHTLAELGGLDLAILGIGTNGHIAFNEPASELTARTHRARLALASRRAHAGPFGSWRKVPAHALTMGIGTLLRARRVLLMATGAPKASIVRRALAGPVTTRLPASLLQLHPHVDVVRDRAAAAGWRTTGSITTASSRRARN
jgi:glucosamine-6-phosphate deaminase